MKTPMRTLLLLLTLTLPGMSPSALAGDGLLGLDHRVPYDNSGIWSRDVQLGLMYSMLATEIGMAAWEGGDSRLGHTAWQAIDASLATGLAVQAMKLGFSRVRPRDSADPKLWFKGGGNASFPSGESSFTTAVVTPFILEYGHDHPAVYALAALPVYDAVARVKTWGHWQSDVIAGVAIGATIGYFMHGRESPLVLSVMPQGVQVGLSKRW